MSRLLLDTHTFLWCLSDVEQLAEDIQAAIVNPHNRAEGLILVTRDGLMRRYDVPIMKV